MPYQADISRGNPACFLFLIDQSGSMEQALAGQPGQRKMDHAANSINRVLDAVSQRCSQGLEIRDYFHVGVITYSTDSRGNPIVETGFPGTTLDMPFLLISQMVDAAQVEERVVKESDGAGGLVEVTRRVPVWFRPKASYGTPMCEALEAGVWALEDWVAQYPDSFPPIVINITDGAATGREPEPQARQLMSLGTKDGNVLLFNIHLSEVAAMPVQYPDRVDGLPDELARRLFDMSSVLPAPSLDLAASLDLPVTEASRGFVFNSDMTALVQFLDIGTRGPSNLQ